MKKRITEVEVEGGVVLRVPSCTPASDLSGWETLMTMTNGQFPCRYFNAQDEAENFLLTARKRFPAAKIDLEPPTQHHPAHWVVFAHK